METYSSKRSLVAECALVLALLVGPASSAGPPTPNVVVVNDPTNPIPVVVSPGERIVLRLREGIEPLGRFTVPAGKQLLIDQITFGNEFNLGFSSQVERDDYVEGISNGTRQHLLSIQITVEYPAASCPEPLSVGACPDQVLDFPFPIVRAFTDVDNETNAIVSQAGVQQVSLFVSELGLLSVDAPRGGHVALVWGRLIDQP